MLSPRPLKAAWGQQKVAVVSVPAEGSPWTQTVLGGFCWAPVAARFTLTAGAEAGERFASIILKDGSGHNLGECLSGLVDEEAKATTVTFMRDASFFGGVKNSVQTLAMPGMVLEEGWTIEGTAAGLKPKDKLTAITLWVEEFELSYDHTRDELVAAIREMDDLTGGQQHG
jgi:hypothetical protein